MKPVLLFAYTSSARLCLPPFSPFFRSCTGGDPGCFGWSWPPQLVSDLSVTTFSQHVLKPQLSVFQEATPPAATITSSDIPAPLMGTSSLQRCSHLLGLVNWSFSLLHALRLGPMLYCPDIYHCRYHWERWWRRKGLFHNECIDYSSALLPASYISGITFHIWSLPCQSTFQ